MSFLLVAWNYLWWVGIGKYHRNWQILQMRASPTKLIIMQLPIFMFQGKRWESRKNKFSQLPSVRLAALFLSYFVVTKIWNNRLITAQAGRISQLLSCLSRDSKQDWLQLKHLLLNIQRIVHSPRQPLGSHFILPVTSSWFCPVQNGACIRHQSGKGI